MRINAKQCGIWAALLLGTVVTASASTLVTFQVDMSQAVASATFDPLTQTVDVRGSFGGWDTHPFALTNNPSGANTNLWTGTTNIPQNGIVIDFKYVIQPGNAYEGSHNRVLALPSASGGSVTVPPAYYNDTPPAPFTCDVTFQVDLAQQINVGTFIPGTSVVDTRGGFNGWAGVDVMTNNPTILRTNQNGLVTSNVYVWTYTISGSPGQTFDYKHHIDPGDHWESPAPGTGDPNDNNNRFFTLSSNATQTVAVHFFNDSPYAPLATNAVLFQVDMTGKILDQEFDPTTGTVEVRGDFNGWGTPQILCTNDPAALNTNIYRAVVSIPDGVGAYRSYKFWASIATNGGWETFGGNRALQIVSGTSLILPVHFFDDVVPSAGTLAITLAGTTVILDWSGHPGVRVQSNTTVSGGIWVDDLSTDGLSTITYPIGSGPKYYRLKYPFMP
jgi:hypothetical protein